VSRDFLLLVFFLNQFPPSLWLYQGCWWNERSLNRGLNRGRGLGLGGFFSDSCSKLEIDEAFQISHKLGLGLAEKFSKAFAIQLDRYRGQYTPRPSAHPPIIPCLVCFPGFHALLAAHVLTIWWLWWGERSPHPLSPAPPSSPPTPLIWYFLHSKSQRLFPETVFINVCGAQELPRNEFRQPM
jgi:hypothetical protein